MSRLFSPIRLALCLLGATAGLYAVQPTITSVSPTSGPAAGGTTVVLTGTDLTGATTVSFGGTLAGFTVDSATQITATSPARSAGTVDITVTTAGGTSATSAADEFTFIEAPTVISVIPSAGPTAGGTSVTLTGTSFIGASAVKFGGTSAGFTVDSATQITVTSPLGAAGVVDITVIGPGGTSATGVGDQFTYAAAPTVTSISPSAGPTAGGTSVTITGTNLAGATAVNFGGTPGTITANNATSITATSPAGTGVVDITVTTAGGTSATSGADQFTYVPAPTVASLTPAIGSTAGGTSVVLTGTNFSGASAVMFGANAATNYSVNSATQIAAVAPAGVAGTVNVRVTTGGGTSATAAGNQFTYDAGPAVVSVAVPADGSYKAGANLDFTISWDQTLTITGTPQLALTIGNSTVQASYVSSPTATTTLFRYTVLAGQNDSDGITLDALTLNGGTIRNSNGTDATLTLNSVASTSQVLIDTTAPTISSIARNNPATVNTSGTTATWRVTFGERVTGVDIGDFQLTLVGGTASGALASVTPAGAGVYDVAVNSITGRGQLRLDLKASGTGIADLANNALSGGFTSGDFYQVGVTNVFDAVSLTNGATLTVAHFTTLKVAQRFTTAAAAPLSLTTVMAAVGVVSGTPVPVVTINADNAGAPGTVVATLTNPGSLTSNTLATWTGSTLLTASTTYWIVFDDNSASASYQINASTLTSGGAGTWLNSPADYVFRSGANAATSQTGAVQMAIGATSIPSITSALTASGVNGSSFTYQITATNLPSSYGATGLPTGLTLTAGTGVIAGTPTQTGVFNVSLTATNGSGTSTPATLVLTIDWPPSTPATVTVTNLSFVYDGKPHGVTVTTTPAGLAYEVTYNTSTALPVNVGTYAVNARVTAGGYVGFDNTKTLTITKGTQTIAFSSPIIRLGSTTELSATASSGLAVTFTVVSGPASMTTATGLTPSGNGQVVVRASQGGNANFNAATNVEYTITVEGAPMPIVSSGAGPIISGGSVTLTQSTTISGSTTQWQRDGGNIIGGTGSSITLTDLQPSSAGLYSSTSTLAGGVITSTSDPTIVGLSTDQKVIGTGSEVGANIVHPNGNTYDQVLLGGSAASITADKSQVTRISFIDLSNDIVQVEFSGAGTLSVVMDDASTPAPAANYNQAGVDYVRGHAGLVITGANETSNLNIFTVGKSTAVNQSLFKDGVNYDGVADVAYVAIQSTNGKFGGVKTGDVHFWATTGFTGVYAPGVTFSGPVNIGNVEAFDSATPVLIFGSAGTVNITGGSLKQTNNQPVQVSGITALKFVDGSTSGGTTLKAQANQAVLIENGVNVTTKIVVNPTP